MRAARLTEGQQEMTMNVLLVDDHALVRSGLRYILNHIEPTATVLEATDGGEALRLAAEHLPDLCLLDISMPGMNGLATLTQLQAASPQTRVLMVSMHSSRQHVNEALKAGARGYLLKDAAVDELAAAIKAVNEGRPYLSRHIADEVLVEYLRGGTPGGSAEEAAPDSPERQDPLTPRQREVLVRIAEGASTREIAEALNLSVKTVETHRAEVMRRLDIHDVAGLTRYAVRRGLVAL
jgi:DNA-binding NarL/FixJ family response regulator